MFYKNGDSVQARGFRTTYKIYRELLGKDCSQPCQRLDPQEGNPIPTGSGCTCDLCEVCGINGDQIGMIMCECCSERGKEVQACYSCLPYQQLQWLLDDPEAVHHWRCRSCR